MSTANMDTLNTSKLRLRSSFERKQGEVDALITRAATTSELRTELTQLQDRWEKLEKVYDDMFNLLEVVTDDKKVSERLAVESNDRDHDYDEYARVVIAANEIIDARNPPPQPPPLPEPLQPVRQRVKLPQLELRSFDGDILKWTSFWDSFQNAVHSRTDLKDDEKFNYLRRYLTGDALRSVEGLSLTAASYAKAIDTLKKEYGQEESVKQARLLRLYKLHDIRRATDTASLKRLYAEVNSHIRELEALGHPIDSLSSYLITLLLQKMPIELQTIWTRDRNRSATDHEAILTFISNELAAIEERDRLNAFEKELSDSKPQPRDAKPPSKPTAAALTAGAAKNSVLPCLFCNETSHRSGRCKLEIEARKAALMKAGRCFICTKKGHRATACTEDKKCYNCGAGNHHTFICNQSKGGRATEVKSGESHVQQGGTALLASDLSTKSEPVDQILFMTGQLIVYGSSGKGKCRILIDSCSKLSYITKRLAQEVQPRSIKKERLRIAGFGGVITERKTRKLAIEVGGLRDSEAICSFEVYETDVICDPISRVSTENWLHRMEEEGLALADEAKDLQDPNWSGDIDLLIGASEAARILTGRVKRINEAVLAVETIFGWVVMGGATDSNNTSTLITLAKSFELEEDDRNLTNLWELDVVGITENESETIEVNEDPTMIHFESTIEFRDGRYHVNLPWKLDHPQLPTNEEIALKRLNFLLRRLRGSPEILEQYGAHLQDHLDRDFVEEVPEDQLKGRPGAVHYLPHRPVIRTDKVSTKIRSVFDASAGTPSLNSCLETGPNLMKSLMDILIRFRSHKIALTADIEKAFLQIRITEEHRDLVRFVWVEDPLAENPKIKHYRWKSVVFGVTTSPFLLTATLRHHVSQFSETFKATVEALMEDMYMDDFISGEDSSEEAERLASEATEILKEAAFPLRRWFTNDQELQRKLSPESSDQTVGFTDPQSKVLGLVWHTKEDCFVFDARAFLDYCQSYIGRCTKRNVLATSSRLFDPLGIISPIIIAPKILLQRIWQTGLSWDDELPPALKRSWNEWTESLAALADLKIPRYYFLGQDKPLQLELHLFSDASERAYGTVGYIRSQDSSGLCRVTLVSSKTRVAPLKRMTLPRLELMGCVLSVRLAQSIKNAIPTLLSDVPTYFWTDSQIALSWINRSSSTLKTFVANRVQNIQSATSPDLWKFVPGKENPADLCSRGVATAALVDPRSIWWCGPAWLGQSPDNWPSDSPPSELCPDAKSELKKATVLLACSNPLTASIFKLETFGTLTRLLRHTAHVLRGFGNVIADRLKRPDLHRHGELTARELFLARSYWFRHIQSLGYEKELRELRRTGRVHLTSSLSKLNPYLDPSDGLMKIRSRVNESIDLEQPLNLPILPGKLPGKPDVSHFITLLIRATHSKLLHTGVRDTLVELREFCWIPKGRQIVKQILKYCVPCNKVLKKPIQQPTASLPLDRCSFAPPFDVTGLDFAGPFYLRDVDEKSWMCLFTCATTRAVHLELVKSMSTPCFLMALERFIGRRGVCRIIYSDNARTFKRAAKEIANRWKKIDPKLAQVMGHLGIEWKFIVEGAPWWGGWWERMVGLVKTLMKKVIGRAHLYANELETLMIRVEAVVNCRPITFLVRRSPGTPTTLPI